MTGIETLLDGFRKFREMYFEKAPGLYRDLLIHGQNPRFAVVACSDSRVDPAIVLQTEPGDIFAVRNVAALVPPREDDGHYHGTSAALEFAVSELGVDHIIILGHAHCGGVAAMVRKQESGVVGGTFGRGFQPPHSQCTLVPPPPRPPRGGLGLYCGLDGQHRLLDDARAL